LDYLVPVVKTLWFSYRRPAAADGFIQPLFRVNNSLAAILFREAPLHATFTSAFYPGAGCLWALIPGPFSYYVCRDQAGDWFSYDSINLRETPATCVSSPGKKHNIILSVLYFFDSTPLGSAWQALYF
jgi:hypothetical protein